MNSKESETLAIVKTDVKWIKDTLGKIDDNLNKHIEISDEQNNIFDGRIDNHDGRIRTLENSKRYNKSTKKEKSENNRMMIATIGLIVSTAINVIQILWRL